jgi:hypothetical protein
MQTLIVEIRVRDRSWIQLVFRVPILRPPYSSVVLRGQNPKKYPQVEGLRVGVTKRHGKVRRDRYRT